LIRELSEWCSFHHTSSRPRLSRDGKPGPASPRRSARCDRPISELADNSKAIALKLAWLQFHCNDLTCRALDSSVVHGLLVVGSLVAVPAEFEKMVCSIGIVAVRLMITANAICVGTVEACEAVSGTLKSLWCHRLPGRTRMLPQCSPRLKRQTCWCWRINVRNPIRSWRMSDTRELSMLVRPPQAVPAARYIRNRDSHPTKAGTFCSHARRCLAGRVALTRF
jgi:hypothetical protein